MDRRSAVLVRLLRVLVFGWYGSTKVWGQAAVGAWTRGGVHGPRSRIPVSPDGHAEVAITD